MKDLSDFRILWVSYICDILIVTNFACAKLLLQTVVSTSYRTDKEDHTAVR